MSKSICSVYDCNNSPGNTRSRNPKVVFYLFPSRSFEQERKQQWINFCKRKFTDGSKWVPGSGSVVCSQHFIQNQKSQHPLNPNYNPAIFNSAGASTSRHQHALSRHQRCTRKASKLTDGTIEDLPFDSIEDTSRDVSTQTAKSNASSYQLKIFIACFETELTSGNILPNASTQVDHFMTQDAVQQMPVTGNTKDAESGPFTRSTIFTGFHGLKNNDLRYLTSVSMEVFTLLLSLLPQHSTRQHEFTREDRLLITLMKLKLGLPFSAISALFNCHPTAVGKIFSATLDNLASATREWIVWPSKEAVNMTMPKCFNKHYPQCRVIIDCTECRTQTPPQVSSRIEMYSTYKGGFTVKFLVGMTPGGLICFVSKAYGGRASDAFITNDSSFVRKLEPGDQVMADKGFPAIKSELKAKEFDLVMPPFADPNSVQFTVEAMEETYKIEAVRIHVERIINRIKVYSILRNQIPIELLKDIDNIIQLCCILANLQPKIIRDED